MHHSKAIEGVQATPELKALIQLFVDEAVPPAVSDAFLDRYIRECIIGTPPFVKEPTMPADDTVTISLSLPRSQASALAHVVHRLVTANLTRINNRAIMPIAADAEIPDAELGLVELRDALDQAGFGAR